MRGSLTSITISLTPTLINRSALSLKRTADISSGLNQAWDTGHFSTAKFVPTPASASSEVLVARRQDNPLEIRFGTNGHGDIQLNELVVSRDHNAKRLRVLS